MTTIWHHKISMEDMDLLSQHLTLKVVHIPAMEPMSNTVNLLPMVCIHRLRNLIAIPGLINPEMCHIRVQFHQPKGMVLVCCINSNIHPLGKCNKLTLHMDLPLLLMDIIIHKVPQLLVLGILSKVPSLFLDMVSLCHNNLLLMLKQPLLEVTVPTLHSPLTLNSRPQTMQAMVIRDQLIKLTVVLRLQQLIVHHFLDCKLMLNQLQSLLQPRLSLVMINP